MFIWLRMLRYREYWIESDRYELERFKKEYADNSLFPNHGYTICDKREKCIIVLETPLYYRIIEKMLQSGIHVRDLSHDGL